MTDRTTAQYRVRLAQTPCILGDVQANLRRHLDEIECASADGFDAIVFPELSLTGYYLRDLVPDVALRCDSSVLAELAKASQRICVVAGFVEETADYSYRAAQAFFAEGRLLHVHHKTYLPTYGMFDEERYLTPGRNWEAFDSPLGRTALCVCEELWHPPVPWLYALQGATLLIACAASPARGVQGEELSVERTYQRLLETYAELFQMNVLFANRAGCEEGVTFWGGSRAVDALGQTTHLAPVLDEAKLDAVVDEGVVRRARLAAPLISDDRPEWILRELRRIVDGEPGD